MNKRVIFVFLKKGFLVVWFSRIKRYFKKLNLSFFVFYIKKYKLTLKVQKTIMLKTKNY